MCNCLWVHVLGCKKNVDNVLKDVGEKKSEMERHPTLISVLLDQHIF